MTGLLIHGDALELGRHVASQSAQLAYLDPPFNVGTSFGARPREGGWRARGQVAYEDRWPSMDAYLAWLEPRLAAVRDVLAADGTMWLHLDHRAVHAAKLSCDRVFGDGAYLGEIVWVPGNGARGARRGPGVTHQTLLLYARGRDFVWNGRDPSLREPFAATSLAMHFTTADAGGRRYRERTLGGRTYRYYADEGRALGSVWSDCPAMVANTPLRREATGYPTQKPLKLLDRIVRASSREGALVVDPFCGSGTTLIAAAKLGRRFAGCDQGALALETSAARLRAEGVPFETKDSVETSPPARGYTPAVHAGGEPSLLPLFLKLAGKTVLVVGAGPVAERKVESLLDVGARVRVVAPEATEGLQRLARESRIEWRARPFEEEDAADAWLVFAATQDSEVQRRVTQAASARSVFCVAVDDPPNASAYSAALVRRPPFTIAISSGGATPALTRLVREVIEHVLPSEAWVEHARRLRATWRAQGAPMADRFAELVRDVSEGKKRQP
jgi:site-specific DNA-methyltransferase (adenine-specific)